MDKYFKITLKEQLEALDAEILNKNETALYLEEQIKEFREQLQSCKTSILGCEKRRDAIKTFLDNNADE